MTWILPTETHRAFERNPLVAVVVELRFFLDSEGADKVADYQDRVRQGFPIFREVNQQVINLGPAPVEVRREKLFQFVKADDAQVLTLSTGSLSLESQFIEGTRLGLEALVDVDGSVVINRLGLRYVDVIDRDRIEKDLARPTSWNTVLTDRFTAVPTALADATDTLFACEVASPMPSNGAQTVRFGLMRDVDTRVKFRLDVDRYIDGMVEPCQVVGLLDTFATDILAVFTSAMGPDLKAWMPERRAET